MLFGNMSNAINLLKDKKKPAKNVSVNDLIVDPTAHKVVIDHFALNKKCSLNFLIK